MTREEAIQELLQYADKAKFKSDGNGYLSGLIMTAFQSPWKSVKEELPDHHQWCFTCVYGGDTPLGLSISLYDKITDDWTDEEDEYVLVDYWMPIPELPKEGTK